MTGFEPIYGAALRQELQQRVRLAGRNFWRRPSFVVALAGIIVVLGLGGTAAAAAAGYIVLPGAPSSTALGKAIVQSHTGSATVDLGTAPKGATNLAIEFWCLSAGKFTLGDGSSVTCAAADIGGESSASLPLAAGQDSTSVSTSSSASWRLSAAYVNTTTTPWAINAHGQSYGVANANGTPDLVAVQTVDGKNGFAFAKEIADADGTTAAKGFKSPQDALKWQEQMSGKTAVVPVYESDGTTRIGDFDITYP
jgi:hypothetical protein